MSSQSAPSSLSSAEPHAALEDAVRDGDVLEAAIRFRPALDAAGTWDIVAIGELLPGAVEDGSQHVGAGDEAVGDGEVFGGPVVAEGEARLGADAVVPRRVDGAVRDANVLAAIDVHAVAVGVDGDVIDGEVVYAGEQHAEVPGLEDLEVAEDHVVAVFERDGLVADARLLGDEGDVNLVASASVREAAGPRCGPGR